MKAKIFILAIFLGLMPSLGLNPIHTASYSLVPSRIHSSSPGLEAGFYFQTQDPGDFLIPVSVTFRLTSNFELGLGLKTQWGDVGDNIPHMVVGGKFKLAGGGSLSADFMIGLSDGQENGLSLGYWKKKAYSSIFGMGLNGKLGFMDALAYDALMAFEVGAYPYLDLFNPITLQFGFIMASQTNHFEDMLAMDLEPALVIGTGSGSRVVISLTYGLAGNRKEPDGRLEVNLFKAF